MEIIIRILVALGIVFLTGLVIGILWGLYIGERKNIMKLDKIKIKESFKKTQPAEWKINLRWEYYRKNGELHSPIVVNRKGYLVDGYTSYLIAKAEGIKKVEIIRR